MGSGRSENAAGAPKQGAFPAGLIGAEPIDLAAVRQDKRFAGQVAVLLKELAARFKDGQNHPLFIRLVIPSRPFRERERLPTFHAFSRRHTP
jgi:hypothetical protein